MSVLKVYAPFDQSLIKEVPLNTADEVEEIIERAHTLFLEKERHLSKTTRIEILNRIIVIMKDRYDEIVYQSAQEGGKPWGDSITEMDRAINGIELAIANVGQMSGQEVPMGHTVSSANRMAYTMIEPIGVIASISAFNHPINLIIHQTIPAIAVGAPVVIKPALTTPLTCLLLQEIYEVAGLPEGWCTTVVCENEVAESLVSNPKVNFMSFIGSAKVGWHLRSKLAPGTRCALEHGGTAPVIVAPDAEISTMIPALVKGGMYHAGQVCVSVQRVYVHETISEQVIEEMSKSILALQVNDPLLEITEVGPLISSHEVDRVHAWVCEAEKSGATVVCGGNKLSDTCYEPTLLLNPPKDAKVSTEEVFGPVICIYTYSDREEAIRQANSLSFAFQSAVFTKDIDTAIDTVKKLNASTVMVNDHTAFRVDWMPFGGRDVSGLGFGSIPHTMKDMTREKMMVIKSHAL